MGCEAWLPLHLERTRWSDRWKTIERPLFPGYLFATSHGAGPVPIYRTPGVLTVVKEQGRPAELSAAFIERLKGVVTDPALEVEPALDVEQFAAGDEVLVHEGPLAGFRGTVQEVRGRRKLLVWLPLVGQGMLVTLGNAALRRGA